MKHMFMYLVAITALLSACDPSDWEGKAPPAPDCSTQEQCDKLLEEKPKQREAFSADHVFPVAAVVSEDHNKHGAQGENTLHNAVLQAQYGPNYQTCSNGTSCMANRWEWYDAMWIDVNNTGRVRTVDSISFEFGFSTMPGNWDFLDADAPICFGGQCVNVANSHSSTAWNGFTTVRRGTTTFHRGMTWPAWGYGIFEMSVRPRTGMVLPAQSPVVWITGVKFKDGK